MKVFMSLALLLFFIPLSFAGDIQEFYVTKDGYKVEVTREGVSYYLNDRPCSDRTLKGTLKTEVKTILDDRAEIMSNAKETGIYLTAIEKLTIGEDHAMNPIYVNVFSIMVNATVMIDAKESSVLQDLLNEAKKYCH